MSEIAERYRTVAARLAEVAAATASEAWDNPAPCDGWVARDVIRHMVGWMPSLLAAGAGVTLPVGPPVDEDPARAWGAMSDGIQAVLDDPESAAREFNHERAGRHSLADAIGMFILGDVLIHTWDLARATGQQETLDPDEVHRMLVGIEPHDEALRASGHYGPRVEVPADASEQVRLLAFVGRRP